VHPRCRGNVGWWNGRIVGRAYRDWASEETLMSERPFAGKAALVTGAYRNLGVVTAETLAQHGASVIVNDLGGPDLDKLGQDVLKRIRLHSVDAAAISANLADAAEVRRLCQEALATFGHVDIVVNNAGPFSMAPYLDMEESTWDRVMDVNVKAIYLIAQELAPHMKRNGWGRVINMCASSAYVRNHSVYTLAKMAVMVITESLALELAPEVTVNAIAPGQIVESLPDIHRHDPTFGERYQARAPLHRLVTRAEVAGVIAAICMPPFDAMTGMTIRFDGGAEVPRF
jgi:3-oxoacyl-[acyl-carrier protein] reductase